MKFYKLLLLFSLLSSSSLLAQEIDKGLINRFIKKELTAEDAKKFAFIAGQQHEKLLEQIGVLKYSGEESYTNEEISSALNLLKSIQFDNSDTTKETINGMKFSWYLIIDRNNMSTTPLIRDVDKTSPAYEAGIRNGDVITKIDNHPVKSPNSLIEVSRIIKLWPKNTPLTIEIRRNQNYVGQSFNRAPKNKYITMTIQP